MKLVEGQHIRIIGSMFNDGVYKFPSEGLVDEDFNGTVWAMAVPPAFIDLVNRINEWESKNYKVLDSPYTSESFGGYSYTRQDGSSWEEHFKKELNRWRKM